VGAPHVRSPLPDNPVGEENQRHDGAPARLPFKHQEIT
jgi:hypothetical protein